MRDTTLPRRKEPAATGGTLTVSDETGPTAVIIPIDDYRRLVEDAEDYRLYLEAERRSHDGGKLIPSDEVWRRHTPVNDGYEPEFE
ncbi:type II toxin-antitoxin system prevent-host-death family antitoxin [Pseudoscardovia radai]|uniref:type II toxin-antitoxin system prevent-host-death family antitoxin n=1 Tax=Pseudoscardovia radai TaxID=987066 RepID=UPI003995E9F8